ncbi:MAG: peptide chain release factor N(5)-glutamine methyltransferase [Clostridia bacterium]|nr:peptide chain release factor N(5)-glutamine methyltransferase [Clostridia bacterium]
MILKEVLRQGIEILKTADIEAPALEAGVMLCHVIKRDRTFLYVHNDYVLSEKEYRDYIGAINLRTQGKPLQYITGRQEFMSLEFAVTSDVLIPRHDTEILVEEVIKYAKREWSSKVKALDIGTGSGCIAISLAHYLKESHVTALDISEGALRVAQSNAEKIGVVDRINFVHSDLFTRLETEQGKGNVFDIIVSNPPYIPSYEVEELQVEVKDNEPRTALDGGNDGLDLYRAIIDSAEAFLAHHGLLAFEVGYNQAGDVSKLMSSKYYDIKIVRDIGGIERVVLGKLKPL